MIRSIRALIFDIRNDNEGDDLRVRIVEIATSLIPSLGFEPSVSFHGAVDRVPEQLHEHVLAVARESLTNVARHAEASAAAIDVTVRDNTVTVMVSDDGVGMPDRSTRQSGHTNLAERAHLARGAFPSPPIPMVGRPSSGARRSSTEHGRSAPQPPTRHIGRGRFPTR